MHFSTTLFTLAAVVAAYVGSAAADSHAHCACQTATDGGIDAVVTAMVVQYNPNKYQLASEQSTLEQGAHYVGIYAIPKTGSIDGDEFFDQCREYGAADSTCF